jgi:hypothetical protein
MTSFALAHNFRDCRHDSRHHGLRLERRTPRDVGSTSSIRTRTPGPMRTSRPASRAPCDGAGRHDGNIRCPSPNIA